MSVHKGRAIDACSVPSSLEITVPTHQTILLKFYNAMDAALSTFLYRMGKVFQLFFFALAKASLGPSCVRKEVKPSCCSSADGRSPAQINAKRFFWFSSPIDNEVMGNL